ncbi:Scramblase-domain-containing protein [Bimuria novae-zelandiae CBS 107.79]|uniref:Scramblase-domain-containing protein n=1 Tax=Bimuria novae-zelandiae CBS 107.79 TaxID=1447943 RepID=A0A6A5UXV4_9PLEO|nr:Scramblase-domain-containing protein [Bimuria novae-zelandiae CBS 107.79]
MLARARWCLALPRQHVRTLKTRNIPPGPRGSLRHTKAPPSSGVNRPASSQQPEQKPPQNEPPSPPNEQASSRVEAVTNALATTSDAQNPLLTSVHIPEDPHGVIKETHPAMRLLEHSAIVVQRQLEMMNVLMGFEQANRYVIMDPHGNHIGYMAELDHGLGRAVARQAFKTHRSFTTHIFDKQEREVLRLHRPFAWINSRIRVYDALGEDSSQYSTTDALQGTSLAIDQTSASVSSRPLSDMRVIGMAEQEWAPLRRKYNLFLARDIATEPAAPGTPQLISGDLPLSDSKSLMPVDENNKEVGMVQFARVDEPFLSWDFNLVSEDQRLIGSVNRNFGGFAREIFTDTGVYALRMDAAGLQKEMEHASSVEQAKSLAESHPGMTLDQRAVMLATAVSVDFDYFSRHSGSGGLWPMWIPWFGGGGEAAGGVAAGEAGAAGAGAIGAAGETGIASEVGAAARGVGSAEGWAAGAGTMAGYEAMQRARGQRGEADDASPQATDDPYQTPPEQQQPDLEGEDVWGQGKNPWADDGDDPWGGGGGGGGGSSGGGDSGGEGGGGGFDIGDWF